MVWFARRASCRAGPLACPVLWTVRVAEAPGSRAAAGRRAAIAERPLGLEGRPGNLRGANHTITDVTGRPRSSVGGPLAPDAAGVGGVADLGRAERSFGCQRGGCSPGWSGTRCGSGLPAGEFEFESAAGEHGHGDKGFG